MGMDFNGWRDFSSDTISWLHLVFYSTKCYETTLWMTRSFSGSIRINLFSKIEGWKLYRALFNLKKLKVSKPRLYVTQYTRLIIHREVPWCLDEAPARKRSGRGERRCALWLSLPQWVALPFIPAHSPGFTENFARHCLKKPKSYSMTLTRETENSKPEGFGWDVGVW